LNGAAFAVEPLHFEPGTGAFDVQSADVDRGHIGGGGGDVEVLEDAAPFVHVGSQNVVDGAIGAGAGIAADAGAPALAKLEPVMQPAGLEAGIFNRAGRDVDQGEFVEGMEVGVDRRRGGHEDDAADAGGDGAGRGGEPGQGFQLEGLVGGDGCRGLLTDQAALVVQPLEFDPGGGRLDIDGANEGGGQIGFAGGDGHFLMETAPVESGVVPRLDIVDGAVRAGLGVIAEANAPVGAEWCPPGEVAGFKAAVDEQLRAGGTGQQGEQQQKRQGNGFHVGASPGHVRALHFAM
jgi:hypothetical protein